MATGRSNYSWAETCWSASRHALIFKRRQIQQRSSDGDCGLLTGVQPAPQTAQRFNAGARSDATDFFAIAKISGEMTGSAIGFFFMFVFTIEQIAVRQQHFNLSFRG